MADFALVTFKENITVGKNSDLRLKGPVNRRFDRFVEFLFKAGFFKSNIGTRLFFYFNRENLKNSIRSIVLYDNVKVLIIELPFQRIKYNQLNREYIENYVQKTCSESEIDFYILPESVRREGQEPYKKYAAISKIILKSLLLYSMENICHKAGLRMENMDITIISADINDELIAIIKMLEPNIKFITVLTSENNKEGLEATLSDLFSDTGLSFNVSNDYRSTLKNAKLIINQGSLSEISKYRFNRKSLIINLNESENIRLQGENAVINGIVFEMSDKGFKDFLYELRGLYNKKEICDITFIHKLEINGEVVWNELIMDKIQHEFKIGNCKMTGFVGHRGIISMENVAKSIMP
jgi:hypothetical protein